MQSFDGSFAVDIYKLLNKQASEMRPIDYHVVSLWWVPGGTYIIDTRF